MRFKPGKFVAQAGLIVWTLLVIVPFLLILLLAFRSQTDIFANPLGLTGGLTLDNFAKAIEGPSGGTGFGTWIVNSAVVAIVAIGVNLVLSLPAAYFATFLTRRGQRWFLPVFLVAVVIPNTLLVIPMYQIFNALGVVSQTWALGVFYGVLTIPTSVLVMYGYFQDFPQELAEAAEIDGLGKLGTLIRVVLPLSRGVAFAVSLLAFMAVWGESQLGVVLLPDPESQTIAVGLLGFRFAWIAQLGPIFAGLAMATIPIVAIYLIFNRYISKGIALGGVFK